MANYRVGSNVTLVKSAIEIEEEELKDIRATDPYHKDTRALFGQSPYIVNAFFELNPDTSNFSTSFKKTRLAKWSDGTSFSVNYNVSGERLVLIVTGGTPDVYEMPFHSLNLTASKEFSKRLKLSIKVNNILNSAKKQVYKFQGDASNYEKFTDEYVFSSYKTGTSVSASLKFKF